MSDGRWWRHSHLGSCVKLTQLLGCQHVVTQACRGLDDASTGLWLIKLPRHPHIVVRAICRQWRVIAFIVPHDLSALGQQPSTSRIVEIVTANVSDQVIRRRHLAAKRIGVGGVDTRAEVGDP